MCCTHRAGWWYVSFIILACGKYPLTIRHPNFRLLAWGALPDRRGLALVHLNFRTSGPVPLVSLQIIDNPYCMLCCYIFHML